jgi:hypothetical protein
MLQGKVKYFKKRLADEARKSFARRMKKELVGERV